MLLNSSKTMRRLVYLAGTFFVFGILCQIFLNLFEPASARSAECLQYLSFFLILGSPVLLLASVLFGLLPGDAKKLQSWGH